MTAIAAPDDPREARRQIRLLLVDDEPSVLSALRRLFRLQGYTTDQATGGAAGLELMSEQPFDLVISDMRMPEMDGATFLEAVRQQHPSTVRILLTGYADIASTVAAINRGEIHRYITKPWDDNDLLLVVDEALQRRALERQNAELQALTQAQNLELQTLNQSLEARVAARTAELEASNLKLEDNLLLLADTHRQLAKAHEEVQQNFTMAVTIFAGLLEMRQERVAGHARRVADLARRMGLRLGLDEKRLEEVHLAALLHDIGKIGFTDAMLAKPVSQYSADEHMSYNQHPLDGEAALMPLERLHGVALIVRQHHERVDGHGFPDGLLDAEITLGAKIVAVASDYDGLLSGNLAEERYKPDAARKAIGDGIGTHYAAQAVEALDGALADMAAEELADVELTVADLKPGMQLSSDLLSPQGAILLPKGHRFTAQMVRKLTEFVARASLPLVLRVLCKSIDAKSSGRSAPKMSSINP